MRLSTREAQAIEIYDARTRQGIIEQMPLWVDAFTAPIFTPLGEEHEVVDVGCGTGRAVPLLPALGIAKYHGIDPSQESIRYCQMSYPDYSFAVSEVRSLGTRYPTRFSGFLMLAVLMHIPRLDLPLALASLRGSLHKGAPGLFSTPLGKQGRLEVKNPFGMTLTLFTMNELAIGFAAQGFEIAELFSPDDHMMLGHVIAR